MLFLLKSDFYAYFRSFVNYLHHIISSDDCRKLMSTYHLQQLPKIKTVISSKRKHQ